MLIQFWQRLFTTVLDHPRKFIAGTVLVATTAAVPIGSIAINSELTALIDPDSTVADDLVHFREIFGNDEMIIVAFAYPDVLDKKFIEFAGDLTEDLRTDPAVSSVDSLSHATRIRAVGDDLVVSELFRPMPDDKLELNVRRLEAMDSKLYAGDLLNKDLTASSVIIRLKSITELEGQGGVMLDDIDPELQAQIAAQKPDAKKMRKALLESLPGRIEAATQGRFGNSPPSFHTAGFFVTSAEVEKSIIRDNVVFIPAAAFVLIALMFIAFRNLSGILLPGAVVFLTLLPSIGLMGLFGVPLTMVNSFLPVVLMIISLADAIHVFVKYYEESGKIEDKREALHSAMMKIYKPCLYTSVTTMVGFLSLSYTDIPPVRHFGIFAATGVVIAFTVTVLFMPAVFVLMPKPTSKNTAALAGDWMSGLIEKVIVFSERRQSLIFIAAIMVMVAAIVGLQRLNVETVLTKFYKKESRLVQDLDFIDEELAGTQTVEIMLEALDKKGRNYTTIKDPQEKQTSYDQVRDRFLDARMQKKIEKFEDFLLTDPLIKKVISIVDLTKTTKKAFEPAGTTGPVALPDKTDDIANYLFLLSGSGDKKLMDTFTTEGYTKARIMVRMKATGTKTLRKSLDRIRTRQKYFGDNIQMTITGTTVMSAALANNFLENQITSFGIALACVVFIIGLIYSSVTIGALAIIPNLFPILVGFLVMYLLNIDLNVNTVMVASIAIGLVVDDTIHFFHRIILESRKSDPEEAIRTTLRTVGRALGFTSFVLVGGFVILILSDFQGTAWLGLLLATVILWALIADLVLAPVVIRIFRPHYFYGSGSGKGGGIRATGKRLPSFLSKPKPEAMSQTANGTTVHVATMTDKD